MREALSSDPWETAAVRSDRLALRDVSALTEWRECLVRVGWDKLVWGTNFLKDAPCRIPQIASILPNSKPALCPVSGKYCKKCGQYDKLVHPLSLRIFFLIFLTVTMTQCAPLSLGQGSLLRLAQVILQLGHVAYDPSPHRPRATPDGLTSYITLIRTSDRTRFHYYDIHREPCAWSE